MTDSSPQTITLPLPAIEGMTITFQGVNYLRPEKMLDFATISPAPVRAVTPRAVTPLALLYSTVGVLRQVELRKLPVYISGRVVYPISSLTMPGLRARLIINATSQRLKFLESLIASSASDNVHGMQILGLALTFTVEQAA
ncbi:TPA: dTDP-glucose pyrophosphorylase [Klebsiella pneumoniae]|uniref:dTDP-glucose pyrophosphorylase n=1 Tax=Klebsiella pneumoniae TaxID=573 RepID=UPI00215225F4|nr:dTDP-glucose pyrophosphorylase [Klebsiella pneumoniae]HBR7462758.1 dTDP-glucose pyrophosphorylase [Klebsiella pneumoniae]